MKSNSEALIALVDALMDRDIAKLRAENERLGRLVAIGKSAEIVVGAKPMERAVMGPFGVIACKECGTVVERTGYRQQFCKPCAGKRNYQPRKSFIASRNW